MKRLFSFATLLFSIIAMHAQQPETGSIVLRPMVGATFGFFGVSETYEMSGVTIYSIDSKIKPGFTAGAEAGYQVAKWFQPSIGLFYSQQGSKIKQQWFGVDKAIDYKFKANYLTIPLMANFYVARGLALKIGLQPGFLLSAKNCAPDVNDDCKDDCRSFQFQIPVGISYEYRNIVVDARAAIPCTKTLKKTDASTTSVYTEAQNTLFQLTFGYNFRLL